MINKDRKILLTTLILITTIIAIDLINDSLDGVVWWHLFVEGSAALLAMGGIVYLLKDMFKLQRDLTKAKDREVKLQAEADQWRTARE